MFVDLTKAYDHAIREVIMGWSPDMSRAPAHEKVAFLCKLGVCSDDAWDLAKWIDETGGLLLNSGVDPAVCKLFNSVHHGSWFKLINDTKYLVSKSGGRQGCKLGALVFNLIYSQALKRVRRALATEDVILRVRTH